MSDQEFTVITLKLTPDEKKALRLKALRHGYKIGRGHLAEEGSILQLVRAIAKNDLLIVARYKDENEICHCGQPAGPRPRDGGPRVCWTHFWESVK